MYRIDIIFQIFHRLLRWIDLDHTHTKKNLNTIYELNFFYRKNYLSFLFRSHCSVQFSCSVIFNSFWPYALQNARLPCPSPTPGACSNSCPSSWWCHPTISSSVVPVSSCLQSFPSSGSFPMTQFFTSGGWTIGVFSFSISPPMTIRDWFPLGWAGWISLQSKELSRVFSNNIVAKHQFLCAQVSIWSNSHTYT